MLDWKFPDETLLINKVECKMYCGTKIGDEASFWGLILRGSLSLQLREGGIQSMLHHERAGRGNHQLAEIRTGSAGQDAGRDRRGPGIGPAGILYI